MFRAAFIPVHCPLLHLHKLVPAKLASCGLCSSLLCVEDWLLERCECGQFHSMPARSIWFSANTQLLTRRTWATAVQCVVFIRLSAQLPQHRQPSRGPLRAVESRFCFYFSCTWDQKACSSESFVMYITDHGLCYTFNSGKNGSQVLAATQTGDAFYFHVLSQKVLDASASESTASC